MRRTADYQLMIWSRAATLTHQSGVQFTLFKAELCAMCQHCCMQRIRRIVTSNCLCEGLLAARFEVRCALCTCRASSVTQHFRTNNNLGGPACTGACQSNLPCSTEDLRECKQCPEYASRTMQVATREATSACAGHFHSISRQSFKQYPLQLTAVCSVSPYQGHAYGL